MSHPKVLVVDDSMLIRKMITSILANQFEVLEAKNGTQGLEMARSTQPDLILLDFVMPDMNGYETFQALRQEDHLRTIPVIMMSGVKDEVVALIPESLDQFDFIEKPFAAEVLIDRIHQRLPMGTQEGEEGVADATIELVLNKLTDIETLFIQGTENLIQREVVSRLNQVSERSNQQDARIAKVENTLEKLVQELRKQNQGLAYVANELKQIRQLLSGKTGKPQS